MEKIKMIMIAMEKVKMITIAMEKMKIIMKITMMIVMILNRDSNENNTIL